MARYTHDCENCIDLGEFEEYDLYFCLQGVSSPTVVARFGNSGSDYLSGIYRNSLHCLEEAKRRAVERGLIEAEE